MGKNTDFETSLQVLRGFDTDISSEVNDIKVSITSLSSARRVSILGVKEEIEAIKIIAKPLHHQIFHES